MAIDYDALCLDNYFAHQAGCTSFSDDLASGVAALVNQFELRGVVDVGAGNGKFAEALGLLGVGARSFDLRESPAVFVLDLAQAVPADARERATNDWGGPWLTTCLDALEHIGHADLGSALHALNLLTANYLLVTISHRPSSQHNRFHASVLPPDTWMDLFHHAGFEGCHDPLPFGDASEPATVTDPLIAHWIALNPFRMDHPFASSRLLFRKTRNVPDRQGFLEQWRATFPFLSGDLWRPRNIHQASGPTAFPILHMQDFLALWPVASCFQPGEARFVQRSDGHEPIPLNL